MLPKYVPPSHAAPLDLRSPFLKVKRAKDHISNLEIKRADIMTKRYIGIPKFDPETNSTEFVLGDVPDLDPDISLLLGDIAHNLRAALDYVACELCRSVGVKEPRVYFPICEDDQVYKRESGGRTVGMPKEAKNFIDRIGPYGGHNDFLWALHELDRIDKHRLVIPIAKKSTSWTISGDRVGRKYGFSFCELKAGAVIGFAEGGNFESDKEMGVTPDIAFGEPEVIEGELVFPNLYIMVNMVEEIVTAFGPNPLQ